MGKKERILREMKNDAKIHAQGYFSSKDREGVDNIVRFLVSKQLGDVIVEEIRDEVSDQVQKTISELIDG